MRDQSWAKIKHTANLQTIKIVLRSPQWKEKKRNEMNIGLKLNIQLTYLLLNSIEITTMERKEKVLKR